MEIKTRRELMRHPTMFTPEQTYLNKKWIAADDVKKIFKEHLEKVAILRKTRPGLQSMQYSIQFALKEIEKNER